MDIINHEDGCELVDKKELKQEDEDQGKQEEQQERPQLSTARAGFVAGSTANLRIPLPVASCSDQGHDGNAMAMALAAAAAAIERLKSPAAVRGRVGGGATLSARQNWWGDCLPHVVMLRQALHSSSPDIAVLGPLHGCFTFYMTHLHNDVLSSTYANTMTYGANATRLESAFMWVGGWKPTSALVLIYSLMGIDIENAFAEVRRGQNVSDCCTTSMLSTRQLAVMHSLQKHTQHAESKISKKLTVLQMLVGDQDMLEAVLRDAASSVANDSSRFNQVAEKRMSRFRRLLVQAEELRLHTLKDLLALLTPIQAAKCGVAVYEICSSLRTIGSTLPPPLPAVTLVVPVAIPASPHVEPVVHVHYDISSSSGDKSLPGDDEGTLNSSTAPVNQSDEDEPHVSDLSTSAKTKLNPSDGPLSQSYEPLESDMSSSSASILHDPAVQLDPSDDSTRLVPSCSNSSISQLLTQDSSRAIERVMRSRSWPTLLPLADLRLRDVTDPAVAGSTAMDTRATSHRPGAVGNDPEEGRIVSSRLLLLSPATSDVAIQDCNLDTLGLPVFELRAQLSLPSDDVGMPQQPRPASGESGESGDSGESDNLGGGSCQIQPARMPAPWFWRSARKVNSFLHQRYAVWSHGWMDGLWRKNAIEIK